MTTRSYFNFHELDDLFEDGSPFIARAADAWLVTFSSGGYSGYTLTISGTDLPTDGSDLLPLSGTITGLALTNGETTVFSLADLVMPAGLFASAVGLEHEDEDETETEDPDDDDILCGGDDDDVHGGSGSDRIHGGRGRDHLDGGDDDDTLYGEDDDDDLSGGRGSDDLSGGIGDDSLYGGSGRDVLRGGEGNDRFVFKARSDSGASSRARDVITDFKHGDKIDLSTLDANAKAGGNQAFKFVSQFSGRAGEIQWDKNAKGFYLSADVNGDKVADFSLQVNTTASKLYATDFML